MKETLDYSILASIHGAELDDMILRKDFICGGCGLTKDYHTESCVVRKLLEARIRMVPMIIDL